MAGKGVKLFKIASELNIGKDTIVEYLQSKGFDIENRATTALTDEMLDIVLGHFQKEHNAAQKQRQKAEELRKQKQPIAKEDMPETLAPAVTDTAHNIPSPADESSTPVEAAAAIEIQDVAAPEPEEPVAPASEEEQGIPVGTVISLEDLESGRKRKAKKEEEEKEAHEKQPETPVAETPLQEETPSVPQPQAETAPIEMVEQPPQEPQATEQAGETPGESSTAEQSSTEIQDDDAHDDDGGKRKRKKKKFGEIQYQTGNVQLRGLTILGKIELVPRSKKQEIIPPSKNKPERPERPKDGKDGKPVPPKPKTPEKPKTDTAPRPPLRTPVRPGGQQDLSLEAKKAKRRKKVKREKVNAEEVDRAIRRTLAGMDDSSVSQRSKMRQRRRMEREEEQRRQSELRDAEDAILHVTEFITVGELAHLLGVSVNDIILKCMQLGLMVSINQRLEKDTIILIAGDYDVDVEFEDEFSTEAMEEEEDEDESLKLKPRAPIVTIMGHVDHGKTSLLDYIRSTKVVAGEAGGITQHIGAYSVELKGGKHISFLDTPGHQAFTAMRARGAQVTDIVILVVAADDSVMPQTVEAISHARAANVPIIVAINKIDKPDANPDRIKQQLTDYDILVEDWGGKYQSIELSARTGLNVETLLEKILIEAELLELKANPDRHARGTVIEAKIDKGKGPVGTIMVQKGTLRIGDPFICGVIAGRVRAMLDERGHRIEEAGPSSPVQILGFDGVPQAGDIFVAMDSESEVKSLATKRHQIKREQEFKQIRHVTLDDISKNIKTGGVRDLRIILKADTDGSAEALTDSLQKLSTDEVRVQVIHKAVGAISESDIMLAAASDAIVIGFHVHPSPQAKRLAENESVDIRLYKIIYDCINEVKLALEGMLRPDIKEEISGTAEVRQVFKISKLGTIAGCYILDGKIHRNDAIRILRDGFEVFHGKIASLKRIKDDVREVDAGYECGISIDGYNDLKEGDIIEAVKKIEIKRTLQ